jgi:hypothetical protein
MSGAGMSVDRFGLFAIAHKVGISVATANRGFRRLAISFTL